MTDHNLPHFIIKNRFQKRSEVYSNILTPVILKDVCERITGISEYTYEFDNQGYNIGRLATLEYEDSVAFITFSDQEASGRNSSFQSVSSALVRFHQNENTSKKIYFYFLPSIGRFETNYFIFMYRLMRTAGIEFLNLQTLSQDIFPFNTVDDIIASRNINRQSNRSNNSTYVTRSSNHITQIFGKTYGANKYETTLLCIALSEISQNQIELFEICENELSILPRPCLNVIESLGKVRIIPTTLTFERNEFDTEDSLRSPTYIYNLLAKLGPKKCALCGCEIPEIIQGAHLWPVAEIKLVPGLSIDDKLNYATDGENGLWLCENHHKLFDENIVTIDSSGIVNINQELEANNIQFLTHTTPTISIVPPIYTRRFVFYLNHRYSNSNP